MDPEYLRSCSHGMVEAIKQGDPDGVWLMETWVFSYDGIWDDGNILDFGMSDSFMTGIAAFLEGIEKVEDAIMLDIMSDVVRSVVLDAHG